MLTRSEVDPPLLACLGVLVWVDWVVVYLGVHGGFLTCLVPWRAQPERWAQLGCPGALALLSAHVASGLILV